MHKCKFPAEVKIAEIESYLAGKQSMRSIARRLGISLESVRKWAAQYEFMGATAFTQTGNKHYPSELKEQAVLEYLTRNKSLREVCKIYKIRSKTQLINWIKKYNGHEKLKASGTGGTFFMTRGRKTTFEERVEIVQYCIEHDRNYAETATAFNISYQQARNYTVKYETGGLDALQDRRGKRKSGDTLTEIERLKAELKLEKAKRYKAEMEVSFLKKLDEIERRRG